MVAAAGPVRSGDQSTEAPAATTIALAQEADDRWRDAAVVAGDAGLDILLVDDDAPFAALVNSILTRWGHRVIYCEDGETAWELLQQRQPRLVISDWMMPGMSGIELCRKIREQGWDRYVYVILATGKNHQDDVIHGLDAGADEFLVKPINTRELQVRMQSARRILQLEDRLLESNRQLQDVNEEIRSSHQRIDRDIQSAVTLQRVLLPQDAALAAPMEVAWDLKAADELAGDLLGFYPLGEDQLAFYLADVAGHGIPAAMFSVYLSKMLGSDLLREAGRPLAGKAGLWARLSDWMAPRSMSLSPARVAEFMNASLLASDLGGNYFTMIFGVIDRLTGEGSLCQAGHPYPLLCQADGICYTLGEGGFPIGLVAGAGYQDIPFQLAAGDRLLLYSDGVTECFNAEDEQFGGGRLRQRLLEGRLLSAPDCLRGIGDALERWRSAGRWQDDLSMLLLAMPD